jgi:hypothetical protein
MTIQRVFARTLYILAAVLALAGIEPALAQVAPTVTTQSVAFTPYYTFAVIYGANFTADTTFTAGGAPGTFTRIDSNTALLFSPYWDPNGGIPGTGQPVQDAVFANSFGSVTKPNFVIYAAPDLPIIFDLQTAQFNLSSMPRQGTGRYDIYIDGNQLTDLTNLTVCGVQIGFAIENDAQASFTVPPYAGVQTCDVTVANSSGGGTTLHAAFTYAPFVAPPSSVFLPDATSGVGSLLSTGALQSSPVSSGGRDAAVDAYGDVWSIDLSGTGVAKFNNAGLLVLDYPSVPGFSMPTVLAIDGNSTVWFANAATPSLVFLANPGTASGTGQPLATTSIAATPSAIVIDQSGGLWIASKSANTITHIIGAAAPVAAPTAAAVTSQTLGAKP